MDKLQGVLVGYKNFVSAKNDKSYFVLSLVFILPDTKNKKATYFVKDLFVSDVKYNEILQTYHLLDPIEVSREIVNDTVRYYI